MPSTNQTPMGRCEAISSQSKCTALSQPITSHVTSLCKILIASYGLELLLQLYKRSFIIKSRIQFIVYCRFCQITNYYWFIESNIKLVVKVFVHVTKIYSVVKCNRLLGVSCIQYWDQSYLGIITDACIGYWMFGGGSFLRLETHDTMSED